MDCGIHICPNPEATSELYYPYDTLVHALQLNTLPQPPPPNSILTSFQIKNNVNLQFEGTQEKIYSSHYI